MRAGATIKAKRIIALGSYLGGWVLIVFFIALLTFIFSFLGTILCAVLAGMMFGSVRSAWWKVLATSLVFPGVLLGILRVSKTEMASSQLAVLGCLCFGTFWGTYWLARALFSHESRTSRVRNTEPSASGQPVAPQVSQPAVSEAKFRVAPGEINLTLLQGKWFCRNGTDGPWDKKLMKIEAEELTLEAAGQKGQYSTLAKAEIRVCTVGCRRTLVVTEANAELDCEASDTLISI